MLTLRPVNLLPDVETVRSLRVFARACSTRLRKRSIALLFPLFRVAFKIWKMLIFWVEVEQERILNEFPK